MHGNPRRDGRCCTLLESLVSLSIFAVSKPHLPATSLRATKQLLVCSFDQGFAECLRKPGGTLYGSFRICFIHNKHCEVVGFQSKFSLESLLDANDFTVLVVYKPDPATA